MVDFLQLLSVLSTSVWRARCLIGSHQNYETKMTRTLFIISQILPKTEFHVAVGGERVSNSLITFLRIVRSPSLLIVMCALAA